MERTELGRARGLLLLIGAVIAIALGVGIWQYGKRKAPLPIAPLPDVSTIKIDTHFCEANTEICERRCATCPNKASCFATGGECRNDVAAADTHIRDEMDRGPDIWLPGCHFYYANNGCVGPKKAMWGDTCRDSVQIDEWFERVCHDALADHYLDDCNQKCQQIGLGKGTCVTDAEFCGEGISSAHCEGEKGRPVPSPTPTVEG